MAVTERYPGQDESEVVQRVIHKHIVAVLPYLAVAVFIFFLGLTAVYLGAAGVDRIPLKDFTGLKTDPIQLPLSFVGLLLIGISVLLGVGSMYVWRSNKLFVTDENIVDMDQVGIFQRTIATLRLSRVQDISVNVKGPMQTVLGYGTVTVQTAGEKELFHFDYVPDPYAVKAYIVSIYEKFIETKPGEADGLLSREPDVDHNNYRTPGRPPFAN